MPDDKKEKVVLVGNGNTAQLAFAVAALAAAGYMTKVDGDAITVKKTAPPDEMKEKKKAPVRKDTSQQQAFSDGFEDFNANKPYLPPKREPERTLYKNGWQVAKERAKRK